MKKQGIKAIGQGKVGPHNLPENREYLWADHGTAANYKYHIALSYLPKDELLTRLINRGTQEDISKATTLTIRGGGDSEPNIILVLMQVKGWTLSEMVGHSMS